MHFELLYCIKVLTDFWKILILKLFSFFMIGFTDDVMLNSRYAHIGDVWFNSKRMCYLKEYMKNQNAFFSADNSKFNLKETEMELIQWKERNAKVKEVL